MIASRVTVVILACILDLIFGDPDFPFHPIRLIGKLISLVEKNMRRLFPKSKTGEFISGMLTTLIVISVCGLVTFSVLLLAYHINVFAGIIIESVICYFMLSSKSLAKASKKVYTSLIQNDIESARKNISMIVGRDTEKLDGEGITCAAVETVAENTSDGVVAPLVYMVLGGAVLGCIYKAVNTLDSMIGYKNERYMYFGKFAARLDDVLNFIPSRLAAILMIVSSLFLGFDVKNAIHIYKRDRFNHPSPNSAQTESVAAGALRIRLGGDMYYFGKLHKKPYIGDAISDVTFDNILKANRLMYMTFIIALILCVGVVISAAAAVRRFM